MTNSQNKKIMSNKQSQNSLLPKNQTLEKVDQFIDLGSV
jgi:hypothetical protein